MLSLKEDREEEILVGLMQSSKTAQVGKEEEVSKEVERESRKKTK